MSSLGRAILVLGTVSVIGTATQIAKGKLGAIFLGASGVGVLSQLTLLYGLLFVVAGLGLFTGITRQIGLVVKSKDNRLARAQMNSVCLFLGITALALTLTVLNQAKWISDILFADGGARAELVSLVILAVPIAVQQRVFRAYLNATRNLKGISRAQVTADVTSVILFAVCAWQFGIQGAVFAFVSMHVTLLLGMLVESVRTGGIGLAIPDPRRFRWREITPSFGYGINGLIMAITASASSIFVGRMIITFYDLEQAGIFSVAWKVATVYIGAFCAASASYYFPTLVQLGSEREIEREANLAIALYMTILPPIMAGLLVFSTPLIEIIFSSEFAPAAIVMAGLLIGDIFRLTGETMGLALIARRKLLSHTSIYLLYSAGFVGLSWLLLPAYGLPGVAVSYIFMQVFSFCLVLVACQFSLGVRINKIGLRSLLAALFLVAPLALVEFIQVSFSFKFGLSVALISIWLAASWSTDEVGRIRSKVYGRFRNSLTVFAGWIPRG